MHPTPTNSAEALPELPELERTEGERQKFMSAYRIWSTSQNENTHPQMVQFMGESHWARTAGAMWLAGRARFEDDLTHLLPGSYYMDPPDGGSVSVVEQLRRMAADAKKYRSTPECNSVGWPVLPEGFHSLDFGPHTNDEVRSIIQAAILADRARAATVKSVAPRHPGGTLTPEADEFVRLMTAWRFADVGGKSEQAFNAVVDHIDNLLAARPSAVVSVPEDSPVLNWLIKARHCGINIVEQSAYYLMDYYEGAEPDSSPLPEAAKAEPEELRDMLTLIHDNGYALGDRLQRLSGKISALLKGDHPQPHVIREQAFDDNVASPPQAEPVSTTGAVDCCRAQEFSSRVCDKGTRSCIINHTPPAVTAPDMSARDAALWNALSLMLDTFERPIGMFANEKKVCDIARRALDGKPSDPDTLNTILWLLRRLPYCYGVPPFVDSAIKKLAAKTGTDVTEFLDGRALRSQPKGESQ